MFYFKLILHLWGSLAGSVSGACASWSQGCEFKAHVGCRVYLNFFFFKICRKVAKIVRDVLNTFLQVSSKFTIGYYLGAFGLFALPGSNPEHHSRFCRWVSPVSSVKLSECVLGFRDLDRVAEILTRHFLE